MTGLSPGPGPALQPAEPGPPALTIARFITPHNSSLLQDRINNWSPDSFVKESSQERDMLPCDNNNKRQQGTADMDAEGVEDRDTEDSDNQCSQQKVRFNIKVAFSVV